MASYPLGDDFMNQAITFYKPNTPRSSARSLREFTQSVREKLSKKPIVDFRTEANFQEVMKTCTDIREIYVGVDQEVQRLSEMLKKKKLSNDKTLKAIDARIQFLSGTSHLIMQEGNKNWQLLAKLESTLDFTSGATFIDEIDDTCDNIENQSKAIKDALQQCEKGKPFLMREFIKTKLWLANVEKAIKKGIDENTPLEITMDDLRLFCSSLKEYAEGNLFVVNESEGKRRAAPIEVLSENQIRLSHLEEMDLPPKSFFIKFESLTYTSRKAYLDLAFGGIFKSRVVVSLVNEGHLPLYFLHMCAGDLASGHASDGSFEVSSCGNVIIRQSSQDVERMTGLSVFEGVDWESEMEKHAYKCKVSKGSLLCLGLDEGGAVFQICPVKGAAIRNKHPQLGHVVEGLDSLMASLSRYPKPERGDVTDSGLLVTI
ncbi:uncharacterized protein [Palaemon carinicauda]|uniref:uncharacterized protein n=1 Tax=Palaemon carinicauda TaxID=392227 RepID=UPI0035B69839